MKFCLKSFFSGVIVATVGVSAVFAAGTIKSVAYNENKVVFDGKQIDLGAQPMISLVKEGETAFSNYMPLRAVLESMGYDVTWDGGTSAVHITTRANTSQQSQPSQPSPSTITSAQLLGTWSGINDGDKVTFSFSQDGAIAWLTESDAGYMYTSGSYDLTDGMVAANYDFINDNGKMIYLAWDKTIEVDIWAKLEGGQLVIVEGNSSLKLDKQPSNADFSKYTDIGTVSKLAGYWTCSYDDKVVKYYFDVNGSFAVHVEDGDENSTFKGTYSVVGARVTLNYENADLSKFEIEFSEDGNSFISKDSPSHTFTVDTEADWAK